MDTDSHHISLKLSLVLSVLLKRRRTVWVLLFKKLIIDLTGYPLFSLHLFVIKHSRSLNEILHHDLHQLGKLLLIETYGNWVVGCHCHICWSLTLLTHLNAHSNLRHFE